MEKGEQKIDLTFMFCNWYSGGTLFSIILNSSSGIVCNGEVFPWEHVRMGNDCSCGEAILNCKFYNYCASEMMGDDGSVNLDVFKALPKLSKINIVNRYLDSFFPSPATKEFIVKLFPAWNKKLDSFIEYHLRFFEKALKLERKSIYVDGTKNIRRAELFAQTGKANVKVIHLVRDGRGFCNSWVKNRGADKNTGLVVAARDWNNYILQVDEFSKRYPDVPMLTVRYEDLCTYLELEKRRIHDFLGLTGEWGEIGDSLFHILGNRMRRSFTGEIRQDLSWQSELSSEQIELIESIMKKQLGRFNYYLIA